MPRIGSGQMMLFGAPINPLAERLGDEFFAAIPTEPGVYIMKSATGAVLYVGKAKNLRNRLRSYKHARANTASRKIMRMLRLVRQIEFQICNDEQDALLTENRLLRDIRPPFNVLNTSPESYYFITVRRCLQGGSSTLRVYREGYRWLRLQLTTQPAGNVGRVFGVFKGRRRAREAYAAILRLLTAVSCSSDRFLFPSVLTRDVPPAAYTVEAPLQLVGPLHAFLGGRSRAFLAEAMTSLLENEQLPRFVHHVVEEDLKILEEFYTYGPGRVQKLKQLSGIRRRPIAQDEIDDLLVINSKRCAKKA